MSEINRAIADLDAVLRELAPKNLASAAPPASDEHLAEIADRIAPFVLPDSVVKIAKWHNGGFAPDTPGTKWLSLEQSLSHREEIRAFARREAPSWPIPMMPFPLQWFPLIDAAGSSLIVELRREPTEDSPTWWYVQSGGPALDADHSNVARYLTVAAARHRRQDPGLSNYR